MDKLTIAKKLFLLIAIGVIFNILLSLNSFISNETISSNIEDITENTEILQQKIIKINNLATQLKFEVSNAKGLALGLIVEKKELDSSDAYLKSKATIKELLGEIGKVYQGANNKKESEDVAELTKRSIAYFLILESLPEEFADDYSMGLEILNEDVKPIEKAFNEKLDTFVKHSITTFDEKIKDISQNIHHTNEEIHSATILNIIFSLVAIGILSAFGYFIAKNITSSIENFQAGLIGFFKYLNQETNTTKHLDDTSEDEIGHMAQVINSNIIKIEQGMELNQKFLNDTKEIMSRVANGYFSGTIVAHTNDHNLQELKTTINTALTNLKNTFGAINQVLEQYCNYNYTEELKVAHIEKGDVLDRLVQDINKLRNAITTMLIENKTNGLTLDESSTILLKNVDILNRNSTQAAAAIEETSASLDEVTSNITANTQNVITMAGYAKVLSNSAIDGQQLANETTKAMDEINSEVDAINEAIAIIDQISFQTNILSLNAAVEAATAGEAGKGFAVVAGEVRNLANRSSDAANEIKKLVSNAIVKANNGKDIADRMIAGYEELSSNVAKTIELIGGVETASKQQLAGIKQINDAVNTLDRQTQQNANIANETHHVALTTDKIAKLVVSDTNKKQFIGK